MPEVVFSTKWEDVQEAILESELVEVVLPLLYLLLSCHLLALGEYLWLLWGAGLGFALGNSCLKPLHHLGVKVGGLQVRRVLQRGEALKDLWVTIVSSDILASSRNRGRNFRSKLLGWKIADGVVQRGRCSHFFIILVSSLWRE